VSNIVQRAVQRFADDLGAIVEAVDPGLEDPDATFQTIVAMDSDRVGLKALAAAAGTRFSAPLQTMLDRNWQADEFTTAIMARKRLANRMWQFMQCYDLLITPATAAAAFSAGHAGPGGIADSSDWVPFSSLANLTGQPAISLPAGFTADGRPVGLQIIGRHLDDPGVLAAAAAFEAIAPWQHRWPPLTTVTTGDTRTC
jgi:aspartyl-tRNA(Asn)/glutamyl-tRNA(Gln) amidotransferase subunit A